MRLQLMRSRSLAQQHSRATQVSNPVWLSMWYVSGTRKELCKRPCAWSLTSSNNLELDPALRQLLFLSQRMQKPLRRCSKTNIGVEPTPQFLWTSLYYFKGIYVDSNVVTTSLAITNPRSISPAFSCLTMLPQSKVWRGVLAHPYIHSVSYISRRCRLLF